MIKESYSASGLCYFDLEMLLPAPCYVASTFSEALAEFSLALWNDAFMPHCAFVRPPSAVVSLLASCLSSRSRSRLGRDLSLSVRHLHTERLRTRHDLYPLS